VCLQVRAAEYKVLAGYLFELEQAQQHTDLQWLGCDACEKWRIVDAAVLAQFEGNVTFECALDKQRPVRGCNVALLPGSSEPTEDLELMEHARPLLSRYDVLYPR
jgi:hypothetical protein